MRLLQCLCCHSELTVEPVVVIAAPVLTYSCGTSVYLTCSARLQKEQQTAASLHAQLASEFVRMQQKQSELRDIKQDNADLRQ